MTLIINLMTASLALWKRNKHKNEFPNAPSGEQSTLSDGAALPAREKNIGQHAENATPSFSNKWFWTLFHECSSSSSSHITKNDYRLHSFHCSGEYIVNCCLFAHPVIDADVQSTSQRVLHIWNYFTIIIFSLASKSSTQNEVRKIIYRFTLAFSSRIFVGLFLSLSMCSWCRRACNSDWLTCIRQYPLKPI